MFALLLILVSFAAIGSCPALGPRRFAHLVVGALSLTLGVAAGLGSAADQKVLGRLLMPAGLLWLLLTALLSYSVSRRQGAITWALASFFGLYSVSGSPLVGAALLRRLESQVPSVPTSLIFDAVLVLGGGTHEGPTRAELSEAGDRVFLAAELYRAGRTRTLVASGQGLPGVSNSRTSDASQTRALWLALGVDARDIVTSEAGANTSEELAQLAALATTSRWTHVGLISSAFHLPRALRHAEAHGFAVTPIAADHRGTVPPLAAVWLVPQAGGFSATQTSLWEFVGAALGR